MAVLDRVPKAESEELDRILGPFEEAARYLADNYQKLVDEHEEKWVAIVGDQVIASRKSRSDLRRVLEQRDLRGAYITFLTRKKRALIL